MHTEQRHYSFIQKLGIIMMAYLLASAAAFLFCYEIRYLIDIKWHLFHLKEKIYGFYIPLAASFIAMYGIMYPLIKKTQVKFGRLMVLFIVGTYIPIMLKKWPFI